MPRTTSGSSGKKETTAEKRERKLANRNAHQKALWVCLVLGIIVICCISLVAYTASGKSEAQKLAEDPVFSEFAEKLKTEFEKQMEKIEKENKTEI